jgi:prolyl-tRNA synthetase
VLLLLRGDHQLNESKLPEAVGTDRFRPAEGAEIRVALGASAGSLGPVGLTGLRILADSALQGRRDLVCGANQDDYHLLHVTPGRDFTPEWHDLRSVSAGEGCPDCGQPVAVDKAVEVGHIFKLGYKYSKSMGLNVLDQNGSQVPVIMGSYGIGVERIMVSAVELFHDDLGIVWPRSIAPFEVVVTVVSQREPEQVAAGLEIYQELNARGIDCLLDDRDERPGVKFKDAELIGFPLRITVGRKLAGGEIELFHRADRQSTVVPLPSVIAEVERRLQNYTVSSLNSR